MKWFLIILAIFSGHCQADNQKNNPKIGQASLIQQTSPAGQTSPSIDTDQMMSHKNSPKESAKPNQSKNKQRKPTNMEEALGVIIKKHTEAMLNENYEYAGAYPIPEVSVPNEQEIELEKECEKIKPDPEEEKVDTGSVDTENVDTRKVQTGKVEAVKLEPGNLGLKEEPLKENEQCKKILPCDSAANTFKKPLELSNELPQKTLSTEENSDSKSNSGSTNNSDSNNNCKKPSISEKPIDEIQKTDFDLLTEEEKDRLYVEPSIYPENDKILIKEVKEEKRDEQESLEKQIDQLEFIRFQKPKVEDYEVTKNEDEKESASLTSIGPLKLDVNFI